MRASDAILPIGVVLLLSAPLIALTPIFTPPPNGCPCPGGLNVTTPFRDAGIVVGAIGVGVVLYGAVQRRRPLGDNEGTNQHKGTENAIVGGFGVGLLVVSGILSQVDLSGPGWQILLYQGQALYLETLGIGVLLFAGFASITRRRASGVLLAAGIVLCGVSLLFSSLLYSDFLPRCSPEAGCSSTLAISIASAMLDFGYLLAIGAFLLALGISSFLSRRHVISERVRRKGIFPPFSAPFDP
jgi:hypothetical protein